MFDPEICREEQPGASVGRGILGAFIGALAGAALYALVFPMGRFAAIAALLIGRLIPELYDRFGGRKCKWKLPVIAAALVLAVTLGQAAGYTLQFSRSYDAAPYASERLTRMEYIQGCWEMYLLCDQETALGRQYDRSMDDIPETMRVSREDHIRMNYMRDMDTRREETQHEFAVTYGLSLLMAAMGCLGPVMQAYYSNKKPARRELR